MMFNENYLQEKFNWNNRIFLLLLLLFFILRIFWCANFPMGNDEVYYWDWSRDLRLSYVDAPPFVAWLCYAGTLFFKNSLGARFFVPIVHVLSTIFMIKSVFIFSKIKDISIKNIHILYLLLLTECSPVFNIEGFMLLPDASLLLGISGALYFLLKFIYNTKYKIQNTKYKIQNTKYRFNLWHGFLLGLFLGIAALSKYHAFPIALGFFIAAIFIRKAKTLTQDFLFWVTSILTAIVISSPVFIWNIQNNFASFLFQSQHGFSGMSINLKTFIVYLIGSSFYLFPWFYIPLLFFGFRNIFNKKSVSDFSVICTLPFFFLFILISFPSFGKQVLPHWVMPGFFLLIPAFVLQWKPLEGKKKFLWKKVFILSVTLSIVLPTLFSLKFFNQFVMNSFIYFSGNADPLAPVLQWPLLQEEFEKQKNIHLDSKPYVSEISQKNCAIHSYEIASLRWYWTARMAFHFKDHPRIFNFNLSQSSFYTWRDPLYKLAGCHFIILGSQGQFHEEEIQQIMNIEKIEYFSLKPFDGNKIIYVKGAMKDEAQLRKFYFKLKNNVNY